MINIHEFLSKHKIEVGEYALVTYEGITQPIYFAKHKFEGKDWFLEHPCELYKIAHIEKPIEEFALEYAESILEDDDNISYYIEAYIKPMIVDYILYEIESFQCSPFLPKEVDKIEIVSERECLLYMLNSN